MEGLKVSDADLVVYLHPSKSKNVSDAISAELTSMLFKFNETFDGVLLAYSVSAKDEFAKILPGINPYFGVRLQAQLLLFYPKPDMLLEGKVVKLGEQSIHIVVLGFSSATIIDEDIREEFSYKVKHEKEVYASSLNRRHKIEIGSFVRFVVKSFDEEILHISGSLLPSHTGSISWLDKHSEEAHTESNTKKRKEHEMVNDNVSHNKDSLSVKSDDRIKKSKSKKHSGGRR
ncbi:DNA-directed RNA polymerase I subunit rpa43 [Rutidosis leptorrhynchoides]|uniref:DNA-directed RNA polymerase I subunit rpa43 n=1 Tax=Rutidosis leptorrhynchoides TaxID=125765 RepID=UPI003A9A636A